jgi:hypothetical protein
MLMSQSSAAHHDPPQLAAKNSKQQAHIIPSMRTSIH